MVNALAPRLIVLRSADLGRGHKGAEAFVRIDKKSRQLQTRMLPPFTSIYSVSLALHGPRFYLRGQPVICLQPVK
jgi:hypothetical protein